MIFSSFLENLLGERVKLRVYGVLARHGGGLTGRGIASLVRTSPFKINQVLRQLVAEGIVESSAMGRANAYRLNHRHMVVQNAILPLIRFEDEFWKRLGDKMLKGLRPKPLSVILYGSVARGEEKYGSDFDIHLVYGGRTLPQKLEGEKGRLREEFAAAFGSPLTISVSRISDFQMRSREKDPLIRNIIKEGHVLTGLSLTELLAYGRKKNNHG